MSSLAVGLESVSSQESRQLSQWVPSLQVLIIIYCEKNFFDEARELQSMDTPVSI